MTYIEKKITSINGYNGVIILSNGPFMEIIGITDQVYQLSDFADIEGIKIDNDKPFVWTLNLN